MHWYIESIRNVLVKEAKFQFHQNDKHMIFNGQGFGQWTYLALYEQGSTLRPCKEIHVCIIILDCFVVKLSHS